MFRTISENGPMKHGKKQFVQSLDAQKVNFKIGIPEWKDDKKDGYGCYFFEDGTKYEGEYKNDERTGKGFFIFKDGKQQYAEN